MAALPTLELGTFTNVTGATIVGTEPVLQVIASAVDSRYVYSGNNNSTGTYSANFALADTPTDFGNMDTLAVRLRYLISAAASNTCTLSVRVFQSDGTTALTDLVQVVANVNNTTAANSTVVTLTGLNTTANKTVWDGALVRIDWGLTKVMGGDTNQRRVTAAELTGTYTEAAATVSGDLAATETGSDTFESTGDVIVAGTMAVSEVGADTFAATGDVLVAGDLAVTEAGPDTFAGTGSVLVFPTDWNRRAPLVIQSSLVSALLSDFPLLLTKDTLPSEMLDADGTYPAQNGGGDIRFTTDEAGTVQIPAEIVSFVTNNDPALGSAEIWVKVPSVSATVNTTIYVWYNTAGTNSQPAVTDAYGRNAVWADYRFVSHSLDVDSAGNHTVTLTGTALATNHLGTANAARGFGATLGVATTDKAVVNLLEHNTVTTHQAWANRRGFGGGNLARVFDKNTTSIYYDTGVELYYQALFATNAIFGIPTPALDTWHALSVSFDTSSGANKAIISLNGAAQTLTWDEGATGAFQDSPADSYTIGNRADSARVWDGRLAEYRIRTGLLSADWITAEYNNQSSPATFVVEGAPESPASGVTGDLAATEVGADTFAGTGDVLVSGDLAATEVGADTFAGTGEVLVAGDLAATEVGADIFAASGGAVATGDLAAVEVGADAFAATGAVLVSGDLAATESGQDTFAASGAVLVSGDLSAAEVGSDVLAGTGSVLVAGDLGAAEVGADIFAADGGAVAAGDLAATELGADLFASDGNVVVSGDWAATEVGADTFAGAGQVIVSGDLAATEVGADMFAGTGEVLVAGALAADEVGSDQFAGVGEGIVQGSLAAVEVGSDVLAGDGAVLVQGSMAGVEVGADTFAADGSVPASGALAATEVGSDLFAATGGGGNMAALEVGADVLAGNGSVVVAGSMAAVEPGPDVFTASGELGQSLIIVPTNISPPGFKAWVDAVTAKLNSL